MRMPNLTRSLLTVAMIVARVAGSCQLLTAEGPLLRSHSNGAVSQVWSPDQGNGKYKNPVLNAATQTPTRYGWEISSTLWRPASTVCLDFQFWSRMIW